MQEDYRDFRVSLSGTRFKTWPGFKLIVLACLITAGCAPATNPELGDLRWVVPSPEIPAEIVPQASNNNVSIALFNERLFMAWRSSETHFASAGSAMHMVSSEDLGATWDFEASWTLGTDVREPLLYVVGGTLFFQFFEAGTDPLAFEPIQIWRVEYEGPGNWTEPVSWGEESEVPWEVVVRDEEAWMTTYVGGHYDLDGDEAAVEVRLNHSLDGRTWSPHHVYTGGGSEAAFQFDEDGKLWAVLRNEDGDASGFGSLLCSTPIDRPTEWRCPETSDPERYDSPRIFAQAGELWMLARRDVGGPYDQGREDLSFQEQRVRYLLDYSARPKRTALYRIDREASRVLHVLDLPSSGDTAFPSVVRLEANRFLVANYSSPLEGDIDRSWLEGQIAEEGTGIYLMELHFVP